MKKTLKIAGSQVTMFNAGLPFLVFGMQWSTWQKHRLPISSPGQNLVGWAGPPMFGPQKWSGGFYQILSFCSLSFCAYGSEWTKEWMASSRRASFSWLNHQIEHSYSTQRINDYVSMSVRHLIHVLLTVYNATEHVTQKSPGPMCGWVGRILRPRFMHVGVFLIQSASLVRLICRCASLATTYALSQSMTWFSSTAWSEMADLWIVLLSIAPEARVCVSAVKESTSFPCSFILRPSFLPVSPK